MLDLNKDEIASLHKYIFETKFSEDAQDIAYTKHVSQIANKVLDKIISITEEESPNKAMEWKKWRVLTKDRREWEIIKNKIINDKYWQNFDTNQKIKHLRILSSPLIINDEAINEFIFELNFPQLLKTTISIKLMSEEENQQDEQEQIRQRRSKLNELRENGSIAFPTDFRRDVVAGELRAEYGEKSKEELEAEPLRVKIAGRIMTRRIMGKASFVHIQDMSGKIQLYVTRDALPEGFYNEQFKKWDIGDIIGAEGVLFRTQTGELSIKIDDIRLLTKALRPLPEKFHGIADQEIKYRQRYLDLIMSEETRKTFWVRSKIVAYIREFLIQRQFLEVETPMMQVIPGGATARPFMTHHNALDMGLYLRIAPELYLKRLVVGGFERVFEINRNFRNEGLSTRHNPEFTMLEFYQAYAEYHDLMDLTEQMLRGIAQEVVGQSVISYQGEQYDFGKPFQRLTVIESILHFNPGLTIEQISTREGAGKAAADLNIPVKDSYGLGKIQIEIFEKTVENRLMNPTFITAYPVEVSPLARRNDQDPHVTDRFEFFVGGREIANGFTELNDAEDQAERFQKQVEEKEAGDDEAMHFDADYITALEHGMPPTAGEGIGIDRLVMLFTDAPSIRDVLLFPHMRPKG